MVTHLDLPWELQTPVPPMYVLAPKACNCSCQTCPSHRSASNLLVCPTGAELAKPPAWRKSIDWSALRRSSDFSPTSKCGHHFSSCILPELIKEEPHCCEHTEIKDALVGPCPSLLSRVTLLTMGLLQQTQAQSCVHLWSTPHLLQAVSAQPTPVLSQGLSPGPQVSAPSPLRPLADVCPWLGIAARWSGLLVPISLCSACGRLVTALCSESLKLSFHPGGHFSQWKGFPGWRNLSSFTGPSWEPRACPNFFSSYPDSWWSFLQLCLYEVCQLSDGILWELLHM